jgi:hypothetical protein
VESKLNFAPMKCAEKIPRTLTNGDAALARKLLASFQP